MDDIIPFERQDIQVGAAADIGTHYQVYQDAFRLDPTRGLLLVADGVGGAPFGEVASRITINRSYTYLLDRFSDTWLTDPATDLNEAVYAAHQALKAAVQQVPAYRGMGTTLVIAWLSPGLDQLWTAHVGDSRAYLFSGSGLTQLTNDHTVFNAVRQAHMLPEDPQRWPPRHMLSQALGSSEMIAPEVSSTELAAGDLLLLCTDGITDVLDEPELSALLSQPDHPQVLMEGIVRTALSQGASDNLTAVGLRVLRVDPSAIQTRVHDPV